MFLKKGSLGSGLVLNRGPVVICVEHGDVRGERVYGQLWYVIHRGGD